MVQSHGDQFVTTLLQDGRVLIVGGETQTTTGSVTISTPMGAELFDPVAGTFTAAGPMSQNRIGPAIVVLPDGRVLVAGGSVFINPNLAGVGYAGSTTFNSVEIFDPKQNTFSLGQPMNVPRVVGYAVLLPSGKVLVGGGDFANPPATAELFDPAAERLPSRARRSALAWVTRKLPCFRTARFSCPAGISTPGP